MTRLDWHDVPSANKQVAFLPEEGTLVWYYESEFGVRVVEWNERLLGFADTREEAEELLLKWVVRVMRLLHGQDE